MQTMPSGRDPYQTLGLSPSAPDSELRVAYRRLVQLHHPDHNAGSVESARRFEEVQDAYAQIRRLRQTAGPADRGRARTRAAPTAPQARPASSNPGVDSRLADLERELKAAREARERAVRDARQARDRAIRDAREAREHVLRDVREAGRAHAHERPSDEELGYVSTDDSFAKILSDAASELSERLSEVRESPVRRRVSDLIDELGSKLTGEPPER
jgi:curved DNA-binding protein CbpA